MLSPKYLSRSLLVLGAALPLSEAFRNCPYLGPDFPKPQDLSTSAPFQLALSNLSSSISDAVSSGNTSFGSLKAGTNSFVIEVFSAKNTTALFQFAHTAPNLASLNSTGVSTVDSDTVFRVGSFTKLLTVYTFLIQAGDKYFKQPVTNFVPELAALAESFSAGDAVDAVSWGDVTIGELAGQLADIGRDNSELGELTQTPNFDPTEFGLPPLNASLVPTCGVQPLCNRTEFFAGFAQRHPVFATSTTPIYSNVAFQILSYALENITGQDFPSMINSSIFTALNLTHTSYTAPANDSVGVIPGDDISTFWAVDIGDESPAGSVYSSASDLSTIGRSILNSQLISPAQTRRWLKPGTHTSSLLHSVGAPWEIARVVLQNPNRVVDVYTKEGDLGAYSSALLLLPDYDIGVSLLAAGDATTFTIEVLGDIISGIVIPGAESAAREEAQTKYTGQYLDSTGGLNSSLTIATDPVSLGLGITQWISNGTDMFPVISNLVAANALTIRLYPTDLSTSSDGSGLNQQAFRAVFEDTAATTPTGIFGQGCITWQLADNTYYERVALDEFLFTMNATDGSVVSVQPRAFRVTLQKA